MGTDFLNSGVRYQKRLFLLIIVFTWVLALSFFVIQYVREKEYKVNLLNEKLQDINHMLISQIDVDSINGNFADMGFRFVQPSDSLRISIVLMDGSVVYDSNNETVKENHRNRPEINNAIKNDTLLNCGCTGASMQNTAFDETLLPTAIKNRPHCCGP